MLRKTASTKVDPRLPLLIIFMYFLKLEKYSKNPLNVPILMMRRNFSDLNESDNLDTCDISELGHLGQHENNTKSVYRTQPDRISNEDITGGQPSLKKPNHVPQMIITPASYIMIHMAETAANWPIPNRNQTHVSIQETSYYPRKRPITTLFAENQIVYQLIPMLRPIMPNYIQEYQYLRMALQVVKRRIQKIICY